MKFLGYKFEQNVLSSIPVFTLIIISSGLIRQRPLHRKIQKAMKGGGSRFRKFISLDMNEGIEFVLRALSSTFYSRVIQVNETQHRIKTWDLRDINITWKTLIVKLNKFWSVSSVQAGVLRALSAWDSGMEIGRKFHLSMKIFYSSQKIGLYFAV